MNLLQKLLEEMGDLEQSNLWCCPTRKRMDVQNHRPAAQLRGVCGTVVLEDNGVSGQYRLITDRAI
eukprot:2148733-Prorocentrum_lima.AAC.1